MTNTLLWIVQALLAVLFLFAGGAKLVLPMESMTGPVALPEALLRFIGVAEVVGAIGLIAPGLFRIQTRLTALAAAGLVIIMIGATVISAMSAGVSSSFFPFIVGLLATTVACGRWETGARRSLRAQYDHRINTAGATSR
jgi:hypothetical protein